MDLRLGSDVVGEALGVRYGTIPAWATFTPAHPGTVAAA